MESIPALEVIGGYKVHPAASLFPLLVGEEFDAMVASMGIFGLAIPIVVKGEYLIDGRNRLRTVIEANKQARKLRRAKPPQSQPPMRQHPPQPPPATLRKNW